MEPHHLAWLAAHPYRSRNWLEERLNDGFHVHHLDGNHGNNAPENLVLIEGGDHIRLHSNVLRRPLNIGTRKKKRTRVRLNRKLQKLMDEDPELYARIEVFRRRGVI